MDQNDLMAQVTAENQKRVEKVLSRLGLTRADLTLLPEDRRAIQVAVTELPHVKRYISAQTKSGRDAIEMSVRGYSDDAIMRKTNLPCHEVERITEEFRNDIAKQAISEEVKFGKQTFGGFIEAGKNLLKWVLKESPTP